LNCIAVFREAADARRRWARGSGVDDDDPRDGGSRKLDRGRAGAVGHPITLHDASMPGDMAQNRRFVKPGGGNRVLTIAG
jgi:hypothetical protein